MVIPTLVFVVILVLCGISIYFWSKEVIDDNGYAEETAMSIFLVTVAHLLIVFILIALYALILNMFGIIR